MPQSDKRRIEDVRSVLRRIEKEAEALAVENPAGFRVEQRIIEALLEVGVEKSEIREVIFHNEQDADPAGRTHLSREESDRAVRLSRIVQLAERVFANHEKAFLWLRMPNDRLSRHAPISRLETEAGARVVEELLTRIDYGIAA